MAKEEKEVQVVKTPEELEREELDAIIEKVRAAQKIYSTYTQEQVDNIFRAAALAANEERIPLAKMAVEESGMGVVEDKVIKNHFASEYIYIAYKNVQTCGVIEEDKSFGIKNRIPRLCFLSGTDEISV